MAAKKKLATLQVRYVARLSAAKIFGKVMINKYIYIYVCQVQGITIITYDYNYYHYVLIEDVHGYIQGLKQQQWGFHPEIHDEKQAYLKKT